MLENVIIVLRHKGMVGLIVAIYYDLKIRFFRRVLKKRYIRKRIFGYWMYLDTEDLGYHAHCCCLSTVRLTTS
jgi:hypothetical protein